MALGMSPLALTTNIMTNFDATLEQEYALFLSEIEETCRQDRLEVLEYLAEDLEAYDELLAEEQALWALHEKNYAPEVLDFEWA